MRAILKRVNLSKYALLFIILLGLLLRLRGLFSPILDLYSSRQEQCAMIARNFFRHGYNIFHPEVDWFGPFNSSWRLEFPLVSYLAALLYSIFGIHEFLGRIVNIVFSLGSIYLIFQLTKNLFNKKTAIYAGFLFAVSPLGVYFGRTFIPNTIAIFFSIASLYYFYQWLKSDYRFYYILAFIATLLSFLSNLSTLYLCLPLLYLAYSKYRNRIFTKFSIYLFFSFTILVSLSWYVKASLDVTAFIANKTNLGILVQPAFYRRILENLGLLILTPIGAFLAVLGCGLSINKREEYLLHLWLAAIIIYTLCASEQNYIHYYYQLPFVPIFSIFAAKAIDRLSRPELWKESLFLKVNPNLIIWGAMSCILITGYIVIRPFYKWDANIYRVSKIINAITEKDAIVIAGRGGHQASLYYTDRKGWQTNDVKPVGSLSYSWALNLNKYNFPERTKSGIVLSSEIDLVKFLIKHGADYYFIYNTQIFKDEPGFRKYMYSNFKVIKEEENFVIFDLR